MNKGKKIYHYLYFRDKIKNKMLRFLNIKLFNHLFIFFSLKIKRFHKLLF